MGADDGIALWRVRAWRAGTGVCALRGERTVPLDTEIDRRTVAPRRDARDGGRVTRGVRTRRLGDGDPVHGSIRPRPRHLVTRQYIVQVGHEAGGAATREPVGIGWLGVRWKAGHLEGVAGVVEVVPRRVALGRSRVGAALGCVARVGSDGKADYCRPPCRTRVFLGVGVRESRCKEDKCHDASTMGERPRGLTASSTGARCRSRRRWAGSHCMSPPPAPRPRLLPNRCRGCTRSVPCVALVAAQAPHRPPRSVGQTELAHVVAVHVVVEGHCADALANGGARGAVVGEREEVTLQSRRGRLRDGVVPSLLVNSYGGSPPPVDQPRLVALLKSNVRVLEITAGARSEESTHLRSLALSGMTELSRRAEAAILGIVPCLVLPRVARRALARACPRLAVTRGVGESRTSLAANLAPRRARESYAGVQCCEHRVAIVTVDPAAGRAPLPITTIAAHRAPIGRGSGWAPSRKLSRLKLSGRAGPRWCASPCSSPPHTARNCLGLCAWVEANRRRGRPPSGV
eukprot:scaffold10406_cov68-Phaeocystis_antarctica.AAC.3